MTAELILLRVLRFDVDVEWAGKYVIEFIDRLSKKCGRKSERREGRKRGRSGSRDRSRDSSRDRRQKRAKSRYLSRDFEYRRRDISRDRFRDRGTSRDRTWEEFSGGHFSNRSDWKDNGLFPTQEGSTQHAIITSSTSRQSRPQLSSQELRKLNTLSLILATDSTIDPVLSLQSKPKHLATACVYIATGLCGLKEIIWGESANSESEIESFERFCRDFAGIEDSSGPKDCLERLEELISDGKLANGPLEETPRSDAGATADGAPEITNP